MQARAGEVISKFVAAGLGRVRVAMATSPGPPGKGQQKAAFVEVLKHENVPKVAAALKKEPWKIVKYSDYYYSRLNQSDASGAVAPPPELAFAPTPSAAVTGAVGSGAVSEAKNHGSGRKAQRASYQHQQHAAAAPTMAGAH